MATAISAAHRSWRVRIFATTWLSYAGYYFCRTPFSKAKPAIGETTHWDAATLGNIWAVYLVTYALGQFLASSMGPKLGPRRNVLLGMAVSVALTLAMGVTLSMPIMIGLVAMNGLAQATGWSGNIGTMASWFHKHERGQVMGLWSTNFTAGAITSGLVMTFVLGVATWPWCFFVGAGVLAVVWIQFYVLQRNRPEDVGLSPIDDPVTAIAGRGSPPAGSAAEGRRGSINDAVAADPVKLSRTAWTNLLIVGGFYFCSKFIRYGLWSWAAYILANNYHLGSSASAGYSTAFDITGAAGVIVTGWLSDRYFASRRGGISLIMCLGMMVSTALLILCSDTSVTVFVILLGAVGFTLFGPDALLTGAGAMDIGSRRLATFTAATISGFGSMGAVAQELLIGHLYKPGVGGLGPVFGMLFACAALASVFCAALVYRNRRGGKGI